MNAGKRDFNYRRKNSDDLYLWFVFSWQTDGYRWQL